MKNQKIVAVVGLAGSGKSEVVNILKGHGFDNVYFGEATFDELKKRNLEVNDVNEKLVREEFRSTGDMAIYAKFAEPKIEKALKNGVNVSLESLYAWSEYKYLKEKFGDKLIILSIVTNYNERMQRIQKRPYRPLSKQQLDARDVSQIENLEQGGPIARGDYFILNNGTIDELKKSVESFISKIK